MNEVGLVEYKGWMDDAKNKSIEAKLRDMITWYGEAYGKRPEVILMSWKDLISLMDDMNDRTVKVVPLSEMPEGVVGRFEGIGIKPANYLQPNTFRIR